MDMVAGIDDEVNIHLMRLFNEPEGHMELIDRGVDQNIVSTLHHFGISSIANIMGAIKMAKYYEWNKQDCIFTVATDSMEMYQSRLQEERQNNNNYTARQAAIDFEGHLQQIGTDAIIDLTYLDKKRMHNLKYFTWVEQQGKSMEELDAQWYDDNYWSDQYSKVDEWDNLINDFNDRTGLLAKFS